MTVMANITINNVDEEVLEWFRRHAKAHRRSLGNEIRALMEREARQRHMKSWLKKADHLRQQIPPWKPGMPTAVELIHEGREEDRT